MCDYNTRDKEVEENNKARRFIISLKQPQLTHFHTQSFSVSVMAASRSEWEYKVKPASQQLFSIAAWWFIVHSQPFDILRELYFVAL